MTSLAITGSHAAAFSVTPASFTIADGGPVQTVTITCTPASAGPLSATLTVTYNAADSPATYPLTCTGQHIMTLPFVLQAP